MHEVSVNVRRARIRLDVHTTHTYIYGTTLPKLKSEALNQGMANVRGLDARGTGVGHIGCGELDVRGTHLGHMICGGGGIRRQAEALAWVH
jgi:hypothetical protein